MIRCVLAHELALVRQGLRRLLEDEPDLDVVAEAENGAEALRQILEYRPEAVVADATLFGCAPAEAEQMILEESPTSRIVFLPSTNQDELRPTAASSAQCAMRRTSAYELVTMVRGATGAPFVATNAAVREVPIEELASGKRMLTAREHEVLKLLAEGRTVRSVAGFLGLSIKTVDAHKFNLMRKLGIHNKAELVMWAIQKRVVKLPVNF
ncbi:MAG TPA: response regulator transcription factor [Candidatus Sulfotelmatobacter sp.]|nr:response regulator transcription factor [Candidatus Sulfotelmatobacter sp.]